MLSSDILATPKFIFRATNRLFGPLQLERLYSNTAKMASPRLYPLSTWKLSNTGQRLAPFIFTKHFRARAPPLTFGPRYISGTNRFWPIHSGPKAPVAAWSTTDKPIRSQSCTIQLFALLVVCTMGGNVLEAYDLMDSGRIWITSGHAYRMVMCQKCGRCRMMRYYVDGKRAPRISAWERIFGNRRDHRRPFYAQGGCRCVEEREESSSAIADTVC